MKNYNVTVNGVTYEVSVEETGGSIDSAASAPTATPVAQAAPAPVKAATPAQAAANGEAIKAPMPGTILRMNVKVGDKIEKDSLVCILEAMKMENEIFSPVAGSVIAINAPQGASVATGDVIVTIA